MPGIVKRKKAPVGSRKSKRTHKPPSTRDKPSSVECTGKQHENDKKEWNSLVDFVAKSYENDGRVYSNLLGVNDGFAGIGKLFQPRRSAKDTKLMLHRLGMSTARQALAALALEAMPTNFVAIAPESAYRVKARKHTSVFEDTLLEDSLPSLQSLQPVRLSMSPLLFLNFGAPGAKSVKGFVDAFEMSVYEGGYHFSYDDLATRSQQLFDSGELKVLRYEEGEECGQLSWNGTPPLPCTLDELRNAKTASIHDHFGHVIVY